MTPDDRSILIRHYKEGTPLLRAAYSEAPSAMRDWEPGPGEWSVHGIICHCADAEMTAAIRLRRLLADPEPRITAFDQDIWAQNLPYTTLAPDTAFMVIEATRAWTSPLLDDMSEAQWVRAGLHSAAGAYTADDWLATFGPHLQSHVDQIHDTIAAWKRSS
jgi:hypothetical protein